MDRERDSSILIIVHRRPTVPVEPLCQAPVDCHPVAIADASRHMIPPFMPGLLLKPEAEILADETDIDDAADRPFIDDEGDFSGESRLSRECECSGISVKIEAHRIECRVENPVLACNLENELQRLCFTDQPHRSSVTRKLLPRGHHICLPVGKYRLDGIDDALRFFMRKQRRRHRDGRLHEAFGVDSGHHLCGGFGFESSDSLGQPPIPICST